MAKYTKRIHLPGYETHTVSSILNELKGEWASI